METTRDKLINATFEEIFSHGYQGAALTDILKNAGVHKGSMYHFFTNKKEMALTAIKENILNRFDKRYGFLISLDKGVLEEFYKILLDTSLRDFKRGCPIANIVQEMSNIDKDFNILMKSIYKAFHKNIQSVLDQAVSIKELQPCNTKKLALFITSTFEGAILATKATGDEQDYINVIEELIEYIEKKKYLHI